VNVEPLHIPKDYVPTAESQHPLHQVDVQAFSGPLDLLLFLIRRHQLDIFDIPVAFICAQYLEVMRVMEDLDIDVAAEFMAMAAELVHIKSKLLLPKPEEPEEEEADPRAELVRRLLEYQKYQDAADHLEGMVRLNRDVFAREPGVLPESTEAVPLRPVSVFALVQALGAVLDRQKPEVRHHVLVNTVSLRQKMHVLAEVLAGREAVPFMEFAEGSTGRLDVIMVFLAVLEMTRLGLLRVYESEEGHVYLHPRFDEAVQVHDKLSGVQEEEYRG
jgi:segregation and condensation protein A